MDIAFYDYQNVQYSRYRFYIDRAVFDKPLTADELHASNGSSRYVTVGNSTLHFVDGILVDT